MRWWCGIFAASWVVVGCAGTQAAEPKSLVARMHDAAKRQDVDAFYASLDSAARASLSKQEVAALLKGANAEIVARLQALSETDAEVTQVASVRYVDGERSTLAFERGAYRVTSAGAFPSTARSPAEALGDLRRALAR